MTDSTIFIIDDDASVRDGLVTLLDVAGYATETYASGEDFIERNVESFGCILLDLRLPGMSGAQVQEELIRRKNILPIIFLTAFGDIPITVSAISKGAIDFLTKPVDPARLLSVVAGTLLNYRPRYESRLAQQEFRALLDVLSTRERNVLSLAAAGLPTSSIAERLGISPRTVEVYRSRIAGKTGVSNLSSLIMSAQKHRVRLDGQED